MGKRCNEKHPVRQKNNPRDKLDEKMDIPDACGRNTGNGVYKNTKNYIPDNGEYSWSGVGSKCWYSSKHPGRGMTCSHGCNHGACAIRGQKGTYKRTSYKADPKDCCMGKADEDGTIGNLTCSPASLDIMSETCAPHVQKWCSVGTRIVESDRCTTYCMSLEKGPKGYCNKTRKAACNDPDKLVDGTECREWCRGNMEKCDEAIKTYCAGDKIYDDDICQEYCAEGNDTWCADRKTEVLKNKCTGSALWTDELCTDACDNEKYEWCLTNRSNYCNDTADDGDNSIEKRDYCGKWCMHNPGQCDEYMNRYCQKYPGDDKCACINSLVSKYNVLCVDSACISKGYETKTMVDTKGPGCNIVDCTQYFDVGKAIARGDISITPSFMMKCGSNLDMSNANVVDSEPDPNVKGTVTHTESSQDSSETTKTDDTPSSTSSSSKKAAKSTMSKIKSILKEEKDEEEDGNSGMYFMFAVFGFIGVFTIAYLYNKRSA